MRLPKWFPRFGTPAHSLVQRRRNHWDKPEWRIGYFSAAALVPILTRELPLDAVGLNGDL